MSRMTFALRYLTAILVLTATLAAAQPDRLGLQWNRSGLPLRFPLVMKLPAGDDYFVTLRAEPEADAILAAYFEGGGASRVLVPPGTWHVRVDRGERWRDAAVLFGPGTETFTLADPLTFEITGLNRIEGHIVDLRGEAPGVLAMDATVPLAFCDAIRVADRPVVAAPAPDEAEQARQRDRLFGPNPDGGRDLLLGRDGLLDRDRVLEDRDRLARERPRPDRGRDVQIVRRLCA